MAGSLVWGKKNLCIVDDHSLGVANDLERFRLDHRKFKTCNQKNVLVPKLLLLLWYIVTGLRPSHLQTILLIGLFLDSSFLSAMLMTRKSLTGSFP